MVASLKTWVGPKWHLCLQVQVSFAREAQASFHLCILCCTFTSWLTFSYYCPVSTIPDSYEFTTSSARQRSHVWTLWVGKVPCQSGLRAAYLQSSPTPRPLAGAGWLAVRIRAKGWNFYIQRPFCISLPCNCISNDVKRGWRRLVKTAFWSSLT